MIPKVSVFFEEPSEDVEQAAEHIGLEPVALQPYIDGLAGWLEHLREGLVDLPIKNGANRHIDGLSPEIGFVIVESLNRLSRTETESEPIRYAVALQRQGDRSRSITLTLVARGRGWFVTKVTTHPNVLGNDEV